MGGERRYAWKTKGLSPFNATTVGALRGVTGPLLRRRFRALRIGDSDDLALLENIARGEFCTAGFRNRDLRSLLYPHSNKAALEQNRQEITLSSVTS